MRVHAAVWVVVVCFSACGEAQRAAEEGETEKDSFDVDEPSLGDDNDQQDADDHDGGDDYADTDPGDGNGSPATYCGDGTRNGTEECDPGGDGDENPGPGDFGSPALTCVDQGFDGGIIVACTLSCEVDTSGCSFCGDGEKNGDEECDLDDLGALGCADFGASFGALSCSDQCVIVSAGCHNCGNGQLDPEEACDPGGDAGAGPVFPGAAPTCAEQGYYEGTTVGCTASCTFDTTSCAGRCGDGVRNGDEECDGEDLADASCESLELDASRTLVCTDACTYDRGGCGQCSNRCDSVCGFALGCIDGLCGPCRNNDDCCTPLQCIAGLCNLH